MRAKPIVWQYGPEWVAARYGNDPTTRVVLPPVVVTAHMTWERKVWPR